MAEPPPSPARSGVSDDARAMMLYEANSKSLVVAYLLWFFLGTFGAHRFYCSRIGTGVMMLLLSAIGWALAIIVVGYVLIGLVFVWWLIDAFLLPGWIRDHNSRLAQDLAVARP